MKRALLVCALLCACAPTLPAAYVRARDAAENDYGNAQFEAAATSWLEAAQAAGSPRDRSDARYRAATSYERAGQLEKARQLYELLASGKSERAPRATFALADLRLRNGDEAGGYAALEAAVRKYPTSGVAGLSLRRYFAELAEHGGDEAVLAYIARAEPALDQTELLSEGNEYVRAHPAARGVVPPSQGFRADDPARRQVDDGLVLHLEGGGFDRLAQVFTELESIHQLCPHLVGEHAIPALPGTLGEVHRQVRVGEQFFAADHGRTGLRVGAVREPRAVPGPGFHEYLESGAAQPRDHLRNERHPALAGC